MNYMERQQRYGYWGCQTNQGRFIQPQRIVRCCIFSSAICQSEFFVKHYRLNQNIIKNRGIAHAKFYSMSCKTNVKQAVWEDTHTYVLVRYSWQGSEMLPFCYSSYFSTCNVNDVQSLYPGKVLHPYLLTILRQNV